MVKVSEVRTGICFVAVLLFGYIIPALKSIIVIVRKDLNGVKDYLTYWSVLSLFTLLERSFALFNTFSRHPPEAKVIFILWLTLRRFQGAHRIYQFIVKPYFEKYESDIDRKIEIVSNEVKARTRRSIQMVLWQLFLSPNDGLLSATVSSLGVTTFFGTETKVDTTEVNLSSSALSKKLLGEVSKMLREGMFVDLGLNLDTCEAVCISFAGNEKLLRIHSAIDDSARSNRPMESLSQPITPQDNLVDEKEANRVSYGRPRSVSRTRMRPFSTSQAGSSVYEGLNITVPLIFICEVALDPEDPEVVIVSVDVSIRKTVRFLQSLFPSRQTHNNQADLTPSAVRKLSDQLKLFDGIPVSPIPSMFVVFSESQDEAEALQAGMQLLVCTVRSRSSRLISKLGKIRCLLLTRNAIDKWKAV